MAAVAAANVQHRARLESTPETDACTNACIAARCGDGIVRAGTEACDDGNTNNRDGCDDRCGRTFNIIPGEAINISGALDSGNATWARPSEECNRTTGSATYYYETWRITNNPGRRSVTVDATWSGVDGYLHVFREPFAPPSLTSCVAGDDDDYSILRSRLSSIAIGPGETLVIVASTYSRGETGSYTLRVTTN